MRERTVDEAIVPHVSTHPMGALPACGCLEGGVELLGSVLSQANPKRCWMALGVASQPASIRVNQPLGAATHNMQSGAHRRRATQHTWLCCARQRSQQFKRRPNQAPSMCLTSGQTHPKAAKAPRMCDTHGNIVLEHSGFASLAQPTIMEE
jgi:hypothetical protein